jgi:gluconate 2-dehydrogenase alpha chain
VKTDVVVIGLGWAGSIIAKELADEGPGRGRALSAGPWRDTARDF